MHSKSVGDGPIEQRVNDVTTIVSKVNLVDGEGHGVAVCRLRTKT